jgi:hypothetical protein
MFNTDMAPLDLADRLMIGIALSVVGFALIECARILALPAHFV